MTANFTWYVTRNLTKYGQFLSFTPNRVHIYCTSTRKINLHSVVCNVMKSNDAHAFLSMKVYITLNAVKTIHSSTDQTTVALIKR